MRLFAAGFNAWSQLNFTAKTSGGDNGADSEPDDIFPFECVLTSSTIANLRPFLTYTAVTTERGRLEAGAPPQSYGGDDYHVEALNGRILVRDDSGTLREYASSADFRQQHAPTLRLPGHPDIVQIVAYDTGFAARDAGGSVWTWGDSRFPECFGRPVTDESPADRSCRVSCLEDLPTGPIVQVAAGGYVLAARTRGRDLYVWGGYPGRKRVLDEVSGDPVPVVVASEGDDNCNAEMDIIDVGVGEAHMIVLMADGSVCAIGSNSNGQLGLDPSERAATTSWIRVPLPLREQEHVVGVAAGPRSSFVLVDTAGGQHTDI